MRDLGLSSCASDGSYLTQTYLRAVGGLQWQIGQVAGVGTKRSIGDQANIHVGLAGLLKLADLDARHRCRKSTRSGLRGYTEIGRQGWIYGDVVLDSNRLI